jgi:hypothetical protein
VKVLILRCPGSGHFLPLRTRAHAHTHTQLYSNTGFGVPWDSELHFCVPPRRKDCEALP